MFLNEIYTTPADQPVPSISADDAAADSEWEARQDLLGWFRSRGILQDGDDMLRETLESLSSEQLESLADAILRVMNLPQVAK